MKPLKFILSLLIFCLISASLYSQNKFAGRVIDAKTNEALAFVNIVYNSNNYGTTTDLDGYFTINSADKIEFLRFSYLGYITKLVENEEIQNKKYIEVKLEQDAFYLSEVTVLPGINPAHRIINLVIENGNKNNPEKMRSFSYVSYNKMFFTVDMTNVKADSSIIKKAELDTTNLKTMRDFFDEQHIFITESVTERRFKYPDNNKETVLAHKMSGMQNPAFTLLTTQFQSFSFYKNFISLLDKKYLSPISRGSTSKYFFQIEDTIYNERADTIFIISYRPLKGKNFDGLQGVLHINSNSYALQNVSAKPYEPTGGFNINIQQKYELIDSVQWFPVQLNTDLVFNIFQVGENSATVSTGEEKQNSSYAPLLGVGKSYISDISLNPDYKRREFNQLTVQVDDNAHKKDSIFWSFYRQEKLTDKDIRTYHVIDSIGKAINLDKKMEWIEIFATGYIPIKFININPASILWFNKYEGYRLGLELATNQKLIPFLSFGGHFAYGFRDKAWKYGAYLDYFIHKPTNTSLRLGFKQDLEFSDDHFYNREISLLSQNTLRDFFLEDLDSVRSYYANFSFSPLRYLNTNLIASYSEKTILNQNRYDFANDIPKNINTYKLGLYFRYAFKEKFLQTPRGNRLSMGTKFPILYFNIIKAFPIYATNTDYLKTEAMINYKLQWLHIGDTYFTGDIGMIHGNSEYSELYYGSGSYSWLNIDNSFNTMRVNEFISDRFVNVFIKHDFGNLLLKTKHFAPQVALLTSMAWGDNSKVLNSYSKNLNKGYFESGIQINNIVKFNFQGYGIGIYYRYGPYSLPNPKDNWAFKFNLTFVL
ncbi:MAG: carboxypeptidase-like regulatory domain-containing protein [Bacteroidales bacterium]|nr:carboxypeptidase-like regulatory domain-containing protein [Bacteroidales bacterium]